MAWRGVIFDGMEHGINCFDLADRCPPLAGGMGLALRAVERRLLFIMWTLRGDSRHEMTAQSIAESMRDGLKYSGAKYFDAVMLDETALESLTPQAHAYLQQLKARNYALALGIRGDGDSLDTAIAKAEFDVLAAPYNLTSEWKSRRLLREAAAKNMVTVGYDFAPAELMTPAKPAAKVGSPLWRVRPEPLAEAGTYAFLHNTSGWTPEELCLAYGLTEPSLATVQVDTTDHHRIESLSAVPERDPPSCLGAQIEMARFGQEAMRQRA